MERQQKRIKELEEKFVEMQKRFDENVARVVEAVKERELRAQLEKSTRRKVQDVRGEARDELNAAVVQTLSESQADLGLSAQAAASVHAEQLQPGARIRVRGFSKPVVLRRLDGSSAEIEAGPLRMKVAIDEITAIEGALAAPQSPGAAKHYRQRAVRRRRSVRRNQCDRLTRSKRLRAASTNSSTKLRWRTSPACALFTATALGHCAKA